MPITQIRKLGNAELEVPPIGLGTWAIGGLHWGGTDEKKAEKAILASIEHGITLIDTAPIYGFGLAEEIVGRTLRRGVRPYALNRDKVIIASKCGLEWSDNKYDIRRNSSRKQILKEIDLSLQRLQTDVIDLYQVHWPDKNTPLAETMETLEELKKKGKIRAFGVSNFAVRQIEECLNVGAHYDGHGNAMPLPISNQPPYNIFERGIDVRAHGHTSLREYCHQNNIGILAYGALCRGLLSGRVTKNTEFPKGDLRRADPKFKPDKRPQYLKAVERFKKIAEEKGCSVGQLSIAWSFHQPGVTCALVGARNEEQAIQNSAALDVQINAEDCQLIDKILEKEIKTPAGPEFINPPE
jgi:aryl-alcohol dehydrogenase-like predicted oxidoreductase